MTVFEISIHALLAESDLRASAHLHTLRNFYPRSPCGERPEADAPKTPKQGFLSTLSLRRATRLFAKQYHAQGISIHALLAESDRQIKQTCRAEISISIHALLAESDPAGS